MRKIKMIWETWDTALKEKHVDVQKKLRKGSLKYLACSFMVSVIDLLFDVFLDVLMNYLIYLFR
jgi:hypothetical protein